MVFERLKTHNLTLAPKKCHFLRSSVKFLGHVTRADGIATNVPSQRNIRSFLGMLVFYQQFIEDCSSIAKQV